jgi:glyoxylase I family protein
MQVDVKDRKRLSKEELARFKPNIANVHHVAYKCRDAEETRHFYEDILGLEFVAAVEDAIPSPPDNEPVPFIHVFFAMSSGECIAFFDIGDGRAPVRDAHTPFFVQHISMQVPDEASFYAMKDRLEAAGVEIYYVKDHELCWSMYFSDPSGNRLELSYSTDKADGWWAQEKAAARPRLQSWTARKQEAGVKSPA